MQNIRTISQEEIKEFINNNKFEYFEISSKTGIGINELFNRCVELLSKNKKNITYNQDYIDDKIKINKNKHQTQCCVIS
jgi:translation elongation factor EF-4